MCRFDLKAAGEAQMLPAGFYICANSMSAARLGALSFTLSSTIKMSLPNLVFNEIYVLTQPVPHLPQRSEPFRSA